jgi:NADH-quinone oxidoreductase subunit H
MFADLLQQFQWNDVNVQIIATIVKAVLVIAAAIQIPAIMVWVERRAPAFMQRRKGPNRVGLFKWRLYGLLQSAADAVKLIWKEEVMPTGANKFFFHLAPVFNIFPAILIAMAIPYAHDLTIFGFNIPMSVVSLNVGFLFIFAISS